MSRKFILDSNPVSGQYSTFEYDSATDMYLLNNVQDVTNIVEANKLDYNDDQQKSSRQQDGFGRKVASIPLHIYFDLRKQGIVQDQKAFKRWLNDSANLAFRTAPGRV